MKYFQNPQTQEVAGFDEAEPSQLPYMQQKIDAGWTDITGNWPLVPTLAETQTQLSAAVTMAVNKGAQKWGYDSIESGVSYANSANAQYKADAEALIQWRDSVWGWAIPALQAVTPGESAATFLQSMPQQPVQPQA